MGISFGFNSFVRVFHKCKIIKIYIQTTLQCMKVVRNNIEARQKSWVWHELDIPSKTRIKMNLKPNNIFV